MLRELSIRDLGVIGEASVRFAPGLNVITGETGVGKTLIVTSLAQIRGERASSRLVAEGADHAYVEVVAEVPASLAERLADLGVDGAEDLIVSRRIDADGRSRGWLGGRSVPSSVLADLGLVELCGQTAGSTLARPAVQLAAVDGLASNGELLSAYRASRSRLGELEEAAARLETEAERTERDAELLRFQAEEIERAAIEPGEDEALEGDITRLEHAERLGEVAAEVLALIGPEGAAGSMAEAHQALERNERYDPSLEHLVGRLATLSAESSELSRDVRSWADGVEHDPGALGRLRERRSLIASLKRKHGPTLADVVATGEDARRRLADLESTGSELAALAEEVSAASDELRRVADELAQRRRAAATELTELVAQELPALALPRATFEVVCEDTGAFGTDGRDSVTFLFSADARRAGQPIGKVASGGELSRAMIATTLALAAVHEVPVVVFDEADQGVGGEAALELAKRLQRLGANRQVLAVSHLPQIAAFADHHVVVERQEDGEVRVEPVDGEERLTEISRMLAGLGDSDRARAHAAELIDLARGERATSTGAR